ncbi:MAG: aminotransferase class I/II-fold pyridoxal phosphate-dependent enzyme [Phycisphaeraceae bacterium]|nr:aminotransferase class I/II-fold pyridoxal phosphate-dependent enzyme [Phycisphaeraceae bacterium]
MWNADSFITDRLRAIDASGIRRVFDLAAKLDKPINLSIGQPDFDVPQAIKERAIKAINAGFNRYTQTQGIADLIARVRAQLATEFPDTHGKGCGVLISSGVSGGLLLALMCCVGPGDEVLIADPYFVMYKHLVTLAGGKAVFVDTYPDFQLTAARVAEKLTPRSKLLMVNSPCNPTGVVLPPEVCRDLAQLCDQRGLLMLSDEIYDEFCHEKVNGRLPSPADFSPNVLLMRGYSKTYAMTGWRLGYVAGPQPIVEQMTKLQQYSFVCAPSMVQVAGVAAMDVDMSEHVADYRRKRDMLIDKLSGHFELVTPGGAFYAFPKVPDKLKLTATQFVERAIARNVLVIPGGVFSERDTHLRISYACDDDMLAAGLDVLVDLAQG